MYVVRVMRASNHTAQQCKRHFRINKYIVHSNEKCFYIIVNCSDGQLLPGDFVDELPSPLPSGFLYSLSEPR